MKYRIINYYVLALMLVFISCKDYKESVKGKAVCVYGGKLYLFDGKTETANAINIKNNIIDAQVNYRESPNVSPDGNKIIYITHFVKNSNENFDELNLLDLKNNQENTLIHSQYKYCYGKQLNLTGELGSPIWSSDGKKIYFLKDNNLYLYDIVKLKTFFLTSVPIPGITRIIHNSFYIRQNKNSIYVCSPINGYKGYKILRYDISLNILHDIYLSNQAYELDDLKLLSDVADKIDKEAFDTLFGSKEYPVLQPGTMGNHIYYFFEKREGFFAKHWLGAYDTQTKHLIDLKVFYRAIYDE